MWFVISEANPEKTASSRHLAFPSSFSAAAVAANDSALSGTAGVPHVDAPVQPSVDPNFGHFQMVDPHHVTGQPFPQTIQIMDQEQYLLYQNYLAQTNAFQFRDSEPVVASAASFPFPGNTQAVVGGVFAEQQQHSLVFANSHALQNFHMQPVTEVAGDPVQHSALQSVSSLPLPVENTEPFEPGKLYGSVAHIQQMVSVVC